MNPLEKQFHIQQARLQTRKPGADAAWRRKVFNRRQVKIDEQRMSACRMKLARRIASNRIEDRRAAA